MIGEFKDGRGEFFAQERCNGRGVLCRFVWSDVTPVSCRWEQALSADGGRSWEVNWIMEFTRVARDGPRSQPRRAAGRPGPEEVVAADRAEGVEDLAAEEEAGMPAALERPRIDLRERHAAAGDLGLGVAAVPRPRQGMAGERRDQPLALLAAQPGEALRAVDPGVREERVGQAVRQVAAEESRAVPGLSRSRRSQASASSSVHCTKSGCGGPPARRERTARWERSSTAGPL